MNVRELLRRALDGEQGLRVLAPFTRDWLSQHQTNSSDQSLATYWTDCLSHIQSQFDTLIDSPSTEAARILGQLCEQTGATQTLADLANLLGRDMSDVRSALIWLDWMSTTPSTDREVVVSFYCAVNFQAVLGAIVEDLTVEDYVRLQVMAVFKLAMGCQYLSKSDVGLQVAMHWLQFADPDFADASTLQAAITRSLLGKTDRPSLIPLALNCLLNLFAVSDTRYANHIAAVKAVLQTLTGASDHGKSVLLLHPATGLKSLSGATKTCLMSACSENSPEWISRLTNERLRPIEDAFEPLVTTTASRLQAEFGSLCAALANADWGGITDYLVVPKPGIADNIWTIWESWANLVRTPAAKLYCWLNYFALAPFPEDLPTRQGEGLCWNVTKCVGEIADLLDHGEERAVAISFRERWLGLTEREYGGGVPALVRALLKSPLTQSVYRIIWTGGLGGLVDSLMQVAEPGPTRAGLLKAAWAELAFCRTTDPRYPEIDAGLLVHLLLHPQEGLRCLPQFMKSIYWACNIESQPPPWQQHYLETRLRRVEKYFEALAADVKNGGHPEFAKLCKKLFAANNPHAISAALGRPETSDDARMWPQWAKNLYISEPVYALYCLASWMAAPDMRGEPPAEADAYPLSLAAHALTAIGRPNLAVEMVEEWLHIPRQAFQNRERLANAINRSPLARVSAVFCRYQLVVSWAEALMETADRDARDVMTLIEVILGLGGATAKDTSLSAAVLRNADDLGSLAPMLDAVLISLAEAPAALRPEQTKRVVEAMEAWMGLKEDDYASPAHVSNAISVWVKNRSSANSKLYIHSFVKLLVRTEGRSAQHAWLVLAAWLGVPTTLEGKSDQFCNALLASLPFNTDDAELQRVTLNSVGLTLVLLGGVARSLAVPLHEAWLGINRHAFEDPLGASQALRKRLEGIAIEGQAECMLTYAYMVLTERNDPKQASIVLELWLETLYTGSVQSAFPDGDALCCALNCPSFRSISFSVQARFILTLGRSLNSLMVPAKTSAAPILESWLQLNTSDYATPNSLQQALLQGPFVHLGSPASALLLDTLSKALAKSARPQHSELVEKVASTYFFESDLGTLRCLANAWKSFLEATITDKDDDWRCAFRIKRLEFLRRFIEPLATVTAEHEVSRNPSFAELCRDLATCTSSEEFALRLGVSPETEITGLTWFTWAEELDNRPAAELYCLVAFWAWLSPDIEPKLEIMPLHQIAGALMKLGHFSEAVEAINYWLGFQRSTYEHQCIMRGDMAASPLADMTCEDICSLVCRLSAGLTVIPEYGPRAVVMLLEALLGLDAEEDLRNTEVFCETLEESFLAESADPEEQSWIVADLADAYMLLDERGASWSIVLLEWWIGIRIDCSMTAPELTNLLMSSSRLTALGLGFRLRMVVSLARAIEQSGVHQASGVSTALLEWCFQLHEEDYESPEKMSAAVKRSAVFSLEGTNLFALLHEFATMMMREKVDSSRVVLLLEAILTFRELDYSNRETMGEAIARSPLSTLPSFSAANVIWDLAVALTAMSHRGPQHACLLLEAFLGRPVYEFASTTRLQGLPGINQIGFASAWLDAAGPLHEQSIAVCEAIVARIRVVREYELLDRERRRDFMIQVRKLWTQMCKIGLGRADQLREGGNASEAEIVEQRVLLWAEEFENRLLATRMLEATGPDYLIGQPAGEWRWGHPAMRKTFMSFKKDAERSGPHQALPARLTTLPDITIKQPLGRPRGKADKDAVNAQVALFAEGLPLQRLIPPGAVWIRTVFDNEGALRWWAIRAQEGKLQTLARGRSSEGASRRLETAALAFDLAVELAWNVRENRHLSDIFAAAGLALMRKMADVYCSLTDVSFRHHDTGYAERAALTVIKALNHAGLEMIWPAWCSAGRFLAARILSQDIDSNEQTFALLARAWSAAIHASKSEASSLNTVEAYAKWKNELDRMTDNYIDAVGNDVDFRPLLKSAVDWTKLHLMVQVQGPLLGAPLPWLKVDNGGKRFSRLFERVASISSVVSLTLSEAARAKAHKGWPPPTSLLTAFWLEEHDIVQSGMRGLADLESDLHECATAPWRILSLGHNHVASVHNLCTAFNQESHGFAAAVVGGHGHRLGGVKLADGFWRGDGADLSRVDLLVLVACAVGRLRQWSDRDVEGLYASLAACGARSVIAARWDVDDQEAAAFTKEVVTEFMKSVTDLNESSAYCRAAALNRARKRLLTPNGPMSNMGIHVAAAFELYGAG